MAVKPSVSCDDPDRALLHAVVEQLVRFFVVTDALNRTTTSRKIGFTPQQMQAAMQLMLRGELTIGELAAALGITPGWASRLADELVSSGHVVREQDRGDRRIVRLRIAPEMREHCKQVYGERAAALSRALAGATPAEIETFVRLMGRISTEIEGLAARQPVAAPPIDVPAMLAHPGPVPSPLSAAIPPRA
ncbi:MAG TPA: MarR family winged helix-turn-helix transcriptional regulator [Chloroflexota bacterium]